MNTAANNTDTHTQTKTHYKHEQPDGQIATRSSYRIYTAVVLYDGQVASYHRTPELARKKADTEMRWVAKHKAELGENAYIKNGNVSEVTVEIINMGSRLPSKPAKATRTHRKPIISSDLYFDADGNRPSGLGNWNFRLTDSSGTETYEWFENLNYKTASKKAIVWASNLTADAGTKISKLEPMP